MSASKPSKHGAMSKMDAKLFKFSKDAAFYPIVPRRQKSVEEEGPKALSENDPNSFSNPDQVKVTHIDLVLEADFDKKILTGTVHLTLEKIDLDNHLVILDTRDITVHEIRDRHTGQHLSYKVGEHMEIYGSKLEIRMPPSSDRGCEISIQYETSPDCTALKWLRPDQTAGEKQPYLFSQCQAIHCRSMIPLQDTPSVKCTYSAMITSRFEIKILMSALLLGSAPNPDDPSKTDYNFRQRNPMPSYLICIVGGDLTSRDIGPRSKVWAEPEWVERSAYEFAETELMLEKAEELLGPYVWGHYDLLVLPPSFPLGGMEYPCLTFVTPTLLAGDRSLADVVAHEIAHSWTGNLVTNKTYEHFWLNESYTEFVERKIVSRLHGGEKFRQFLAYRGWNILIEAVDDLTESGHPEYTKLVLNVKGEDPDDLFSSIPYEKGHALLFYLEQLVGGPEVFDPYLKAYIEKFSFKSITTDDWKDFFLSYFHTQADAGLFDQVDWNAWLYGEGMPPVKPDYDMTMVEDCKALAQRWIDADDSSLDQFTFADVESFKPVQKEQVLQLFLLNAEPLSIPKIIRMGEVYRFNATRNAEIRFRWIQVCIQAEFTPIVQPALEFITEQGRMKYIQPIYRDLYNWETSREVAIATFQANKHHLHSIAEYAVSKELHLIED